MTDKSEPAFPTLKDPMNPFDQSMPGLTKREYFAAMAMQGLLRVDDHGPDRIAEWAISYADALIEELVK